MLKPILRIATLTVLLLALTVTPAGAASSPPVDVEIVATTYFPPDGGLTYGSFVASGPAVDAGLICPSGDTIDVAGRTSGYQSGRGVNYHVIKLFTCGDGSGTFTVKLEVRVDFRGDNANWNVLGGTGAYEELHGTGKLVGEYIDGGVIDYYSGQLH